MAREYKTLAMISCFNLRSPLFLLRSILLKDCVDDSLVTSLPYMHELDYLIPLHVSLSCVHTVDIRKVCISLVYIWFIARFYVLVCVAIGYSTKKLNNILKHEVVWRKIKGKSYTIHIYLGSSSLRYSFILSSSVHYALRPITLGRPFVHKPAAVVPGGPSPPPTSTSAWRVPPTRRTHRGPSLICQGHVCAAAKASSHGLV